MKWSIADNSDRIIDLVLNNQHPSLEGVFGLQGQTTHSAIDKVIRTFSSVNYWSDMNGQFIEYDLYQSAIYWSGSIYFTDEADYTPYIY